MGKELVRVSKFMSLVLRHKPEEINLSLDDNGWASINELIDKTRESNIPLTKELIEKVVATSDKQRFRLSEDKMFIRANQGHSVNVDLDLQPQIPPDKLYHGTATRFLESIMNDGLVKKSRQHVHLSPNIETATKVGKRHGKPVILEVDAGKMARDGFTFYQSDNGVWLTESIPVSYLKKSEE